jgi:hypothetical protein
MFTRVKIIPDYKFLLPGCAIIAAVATSDLPVCPVSIDTTKPAIT